VAKLNRDEILRDILRTLVDGWGKGAVQAALDALDAAPSGDKRRRTERAAEDAARGAEALVAEIALPLEHRQLMVDLAKRFDDGSAFPKLSDVRSFLLSHQQNATDLKSRVQGFKRMLPILSRMSPKGLERLIARSHHSGPADLGEISDAIRGAGEDLRGKPLDEGQEAANATEAAVQHPPETSDAQASLELGAGGDEAPEVASRSRHPRTERQRLGLRPGAKANKKS
jgi:hypothetical protein